jgi:hypothetical protein
MKKLNRLFVLFCLSSSLQLSSQVNSSSSNVSTKSEITSITLPEVLLSFDAIISDKKVELTWSSNTENNNNYFTIEKSKDAINFEEVTSIKGFGNYSSLVNYFDVDYIPYEGISYYRLKQTDSKGHTLSSRLVSVNYRLGNDGLVANQNSIDENTTNLLGSENKEVVVVLRNEKGQESFSKVFVSEENTITISPNNEHKLDNGSYVVIACSNNKLFSQKVVVK